MNSKSAKDSALKCFIFFLISQPLVYLVQVPFSSLGFGLFTYYKFWFVWTILTIPMGYIGYYIKKDKWWGLLILTPILILLGYHYYGFLSETTSFFPNHLLSMLFCTLTMIMYPLVMFRNKKIRITGVIISAIILLFGTVMVLNNGRTTYNTTIMVNNGSLGMTFDDTYNVYLKDKEYGKVFIVYEKNIDEYMVNAEFTKTGKTEFVLESPDGEKTVFLLTIKRDTYDIKRK